MHPVKPPFPWFGGKSRAAVAIWAALGDVDHYVEPFAGSLAVLLNRPATHRHTTATVNDLDRYLANFWRATAQAPEDVAAWADWPVNEADLEARHLWLVEQLPVMAEQMAADPDWFDPKIAGWWVWGVCSWIGSGWCSGTGPWTRLDDGTVGKLPHLGDAGQGVNRKLPHLGDAGRGVNRKLPHLGDAGQDYMQAIAHVLRDTRVCCGDWQRILTPGALSYGATVGVVLDPPYDTTIRHGTLYNHESDGDSIPAAVRRWAVEHGGDTRFRIALCGYAEEHDLGDGWRRHEWTATLPYSTAAAKAEGRQNENRHKETIWFSPHCLGDQTLFGAL